MITNLGPSAEVKINLFFPGTDVSNSLFYKTFYLGKLECFSRLSPGLIFDEEPTHRVELRKVVLSGWLQMSGLDGSE